MKHDTRKKIEIEIEKEKRSLIQCVVFKKNGKQEERTHTNQDVFVFMHGFVRPVTARSIPLRCRRHFSVVLKHRLIDSREGESDCRCDKLLLNVSKEIASLLQQKHVSNLLAWHAP